jgi:amino acid transporter
MEIRLAALLVNGMGSNGIITAKFKDRPMPLDKLALICVIVLTALWCGLLVASAVAALPFGLPVLIVLLVIGYFVYRVVRDRIENKEDDYYDKNIKQ